MYTIISASFINSAHSGAVIDTQEVGALAISEADRPEAWAAMLAWGTPDDYVEDAPPEPWPELSQRQFWKVLALAGMHADVMAEVDTLSLEDQIEAKQATSYQHDHWLIEATRPKFGLDDA